MIDTVDIKRVVGIETVLAWYGIEPNRAGFIQCPFHPDKTPSLKIYKETESWHCFGCGAGSDIFDFVMSFEKIDFKRAHEIIIERARLQGMKTRKRSIQARDYARQFKQREEAKKKNKIEYWLDKVRYYEEVMRTAKDWTPELTEACQNLAYAEYQLERAQGINE